MASARQTSAEDSDGSLLGGAGRRAQGRNSTGAPARHEDARGEEDRAGRAAVHGVQHADRGAGAACGHAIVREVRRRRTEMRRDLEVRRSGVGEGPRAAEVEAE